MVLTIEGMTTKRRTHRRIADSPELGSGKPRPLDDADPLLRAIAAAPQDDEPFTADDETAIAEVDSDRACGDRAIPFEEVMRKYQRA